MAWIRRGSLARCQTAAGCAEKRVGPVFGHCNGHALRREVRDAAGGAQLAGARFVDESGHVLGVSDARGAVRLSAGQWPGALTVEREGYALLEWDPGRYWMNHERTLFLSRE